ncbi:delta(24)-sterol reductase-like [Amphibalanus amphitrite]|nr:delta(24)-sterol reductase-like [Amphibalanus amphitrite]
MISAAGVLEHVIINYRWVFVCLFLLPVSVLYDAWMYARNWLIFRLSSAPKNHVGKVHSIQVQVKRWRAQGMRAPMCTARPGWQTISFRQPKYKKTFHKIDVNLVDILDIDTERQVVRLEPMVTMGQLTATLNPLGWTLPIIPEMDDLTVGGLVMGTGVESSSHRFGLFQHICLELELVLSDGSVVTCSREENADLFHAVFWSYGTLGFLTAVQVRIVPARPYVRLQYRPVHDRSQLSRLLTEVSGGPHQFVETLVFDRDRAVVMTGDLVGHAEPTAEPHKVNTIGLWHKPWFFKHVQTFLERGEDYEYIPLRDYYHRHTRAIFWEIQDIIPFGNNPVFRWLCGWMVPPKVSLLKLTQGQTIKELYEKNHFIQDMLVPLDQLDSSLDVFHREVEIYPLWLCPFVLPADPGFLQPASGKEQMYIDIGAYGVPRTVNFDAVKTGRRIEKFVISVGGFQMMYADSFMTREEYRTMFDHSLYDKVRRRFDCLIAFPEVYDKVNRSARD